MIVMTTESPFLARLTKDISTPVRAYVFRNGFDKGFDGQLDIAQAHLLSVLPEIPPEKFDYLLAAVWFNQATYKKTIDFLGYSGLREDWSINPEINPFIFREGVFIPRTEGCLTDIIPGEKSFCGTFIRTAGREEDYRLTTTDLGSYFETSPNLGNLEPPVDIRF